MQNEVSLTHSQLPIWVGQRLHQDSPLYNMAFAWIFPAELRADLFQQAWQRVAEASDALKTFVVEHEGTAQVRFHEPGARGAEILDRGDDSAEDFRRWCRERCSRPLALNESLVDSVLVRLAGGKTGWYLNQHHLVADAWSTVLLYRQVVAEYAALLDGGSRPEALRGYYSTPPPDPKSGTTPRAALDHWADRLDRPERSVPFYGRDAQPVGTASTRLTLQLDEERSQALDRLCSETGFVSLSRDMSRFGLFATLFLSWLHRVSGRFDLGFDAPVAGRPTADAKRTLGLFIEMFPFAVTLDPQETFRTLAGKCLAEAGLLLRHALPGTSSPSAAVAGNVVLNYIPESFGDFAGIPAEVEWVHPGHGDSVHTLRLQVHDFAGSGRTTLHFDFNDRALSDRLRRRSLRHFEKLLEALLDDPDHRIAAVDVLTGDERRALAELNSTATVPLPDRTVVEMILARAEVDAERVALREGQDKLTFGELRQRTGALAATLVREGVEPGDRVAISCRRSIDVVVAILAVLRTRAAYVTIDPAYPRQRRQAILEDSAARLVLCSQPPASEEDSAVSFLTIAEGVREGELGASPDLPEPLLDDLAYVLYTSGSTGRPKGVLIEHGGLSDYLLWAESQFVRGERLRYPLFTSLSFDLTVTSLFLPLITGGELLIYPEPDGPVDSALMDVLREDAVDFIKLTPSHLSLLCQVSPAPTRIRRMVVGGEDFKTRLAAEVVAQLGDDVEITNEYGPTEAVVGCVAHLYDPDADNGPRVPIGVPSDHVTIEILNQELVPVPEGVVGELWISRFGLARGYLGLKELTAELFQPHPERMGDYRYRTGDRVRMMDPGKLEYLGRLDRQLKISGYRVEPAEIETALLSLPGVEQCTVVTRRRSAATSRESAGDGEIRYCVRCGLPSNHPGADFDRDDVCGICRSYESTRHHARGYFNSMDDLRHLFEVSASERDYDCMMLLSGGKDSTYALCRLVEMGLSVYAFTLDNGFISEGAKANIRRVTRQLDVPVEFGSTPAMNAIFRDSLARFANVCNGCFKTIYTLSTQRARELGIPIIVTGLSRGQMFETRLTEEMFRDGRRSPEEVDAAVLAARKVYHRVDDEVSRSLDVSIFQDDRVFEEIQFVDFYRYCDAGLEEVLAYLRRKVPWVRPEDTGRSTNCRINDVGIYVHKKQHGYHNYALPYSWDVRMGHKTREEALDELDDDIDAGYVRRILREIGCDPEPLTADGDQPVLAAFYVAPDDIPASELRRGLGERLPPPLIPAYLMRVDSIPLTVHGKVDARALPQIELVQHSETRYRPPEGPVAEFLAGVWQEHLGAERVGADDSFFELGGTSLAAMDVMIRLCREFDIDLPLETLFSHPKLSELAGVAEDKILEDVADTHLPV